MRRRRCSSSIPTATLVGQWGGPGAGYEWPTSNHGITIDHKGNVWIGGNGPGDSQVLKFSRAGKFLLQVGKAERPLGAMKDGKPTYAGGSNDPISFGRVAKIFVDPSANEAYLADGYLNKRVAIIDADTGKLKRYWGAYGNKPDDTDLGPYKPEAAPVQQFRIAGPLRRSLERRPGLRVRSPEQPDPGVQEGRHVRQGGVLCEEQPGRRRGVRHRVLEGSGADVSLHGRRQQHEDPHPAPRHARGAHQLRRRRAPAGPVLRACTASPWTRRATSTRRKPTKGSACRSSSTKGSAP